MARRRGSDRGSDRGTDKGTGRSGGRGGSDRSAGSRDGGNRAESSGPDRSSDRGGRRGADREIKNGRSLRDVVGGGSRSSGFGRSPGMSGGAGGSGAGGSSRPSFPDRFSGGGASQGSSFGPVSAREFRKVQYQPVMSFSELAQPAPKAEASVAASTGTSATAPAGPSAGVGHGMPRPAVPSGASTKLRPQFTPPINDTSTALTPELQATHEALKAEPALRGPGGGPVDQGWPRERARGTGLPGAPGSAPMKSGKEARREGQRIWVTGTVKRHPDGFGFLLPDDASISDVYISRQYMAGVMSNDKVEVEVFRVRPHDRSSTGERLFGEVKRIVSRAHARIVGRFLPVDRRYGVIQDEGRGWGMDLRIPTEDAMGAQDGDWVAVEIAEYASHDRPLRGRVVRILGDVEDPLNDVVRTIHEKGIPDEFSFAARREAAALGNVVQEADKAKREDLRGIPLITIDGATARDFDDAVFVEPTGRGFKAIIAIADVSHYVKPGAPIDEEAYARGTSTYFPNFVVPMLPEELSNELCSLKAEVDRLCFACEIQLDFQGVIQSYRFFEAVMCSKARVTYGEAQEVIDGDASERLQATPGVCDNILRSADLAKVLMAKRMREGSLDLEVTETQVVVDPSGETIDVVRSERLFAHRLIEELMLVTNVCTARFFEDNRIHGIYRIHETPDQEKLNTLERLMWNLLGPSSRIGKSLQGAGLQKKLTKALQAAAGHPGGSVLNTLTLRAMNQAKYAAQNVGHFGLGFEFYSHFTSPIRRYPDLIAHRLIKAVLYPRYSNQGMEVEEIETAATHLSACEQRSVKAERAVVSIKKARFIRRYLGETLAGTITSVTKFGIFVTLREFEIDGLVKLEALGPDRWVYDDQAMRLYGRGTGHVFKLGDELRVTVDHADVSTGKIDFSIENIEHDVEEAMVVLADDLVDDFDNEAIQRLGTPGRGKASHAQSPHAQSSHQTRMSASKSPAESRKGNKRGKPARKASVGVGSKMKHEGKGAGRPHGGVASHKAGPAKAGSAKAGPNKVRPENKPGRRK